MLLELQAEDFSNHAVSPFQELGAYEALWDEQKATFKSIADMFGKREGSLPSDFVERSRATSYANTVHAMLRPLGPAHVPPEGSLLDADKGSRLDAD